jgi:hypothetical protein
MRQSVKLCSTHGRPMNFGVCSACDVNKQVKNIQDNCQHEERTLMSSTMNKANKPFEQCNRCTLGFPVGEIKFGIVKPYQLV